jgi:ethanolaminephosphotransferase
VHNYEYKGGDLSYVYNWVYSPFAEFIATLMPRWLAPNVITLIAAGFLVVPHLWTWALYGSGFEAEVNPWVTVLTGICFMTYITLDNVDGKQARRTGTSSPLGQIFDHGMDAITFNLSIMTMTLYYQAGNSMVAHMGLVLGCAGYFMFNIKEYYVGEYFLQPINPIDEGSVVYFLGYLYVAYFGWEHCQEPVIGDWRISHISLLISFLS